MSIFISIASYQDTLLPFTIKEAYEKAAWPDELHFGIVDQSSSDTPYPVPDVIPPRQVSYVKIDPKQTHGCSWARSLVMSLVSNQDWFFQIDSHMMFEQDWDAIFIHKASGLLSITPQCLISGYPAAFDFVDGLPTVKTTTQMLRAHVVSESSSFVDGDPVLRFKTRDLPGMGAVEGFHLGGGCLFAPIEFVSKFPWDPYLYFSEEEASMAIRLFTHGWTIYQVAGMPILHLYHVPATASVPRRLHWDATDEAGPKPLWHRLVRRARKRMNVLVSEDSSSLGVYALGAQRSLADFAEACGIDYLKRELHPKAFTGPWTLTAE